MRLLSKLAGITLLLTGAAMIMPAPPPAVPEISPSLGVNAVAIVGGALLILRARKR
jgi:hypothetical protein